MPAAELPDDEPARLAALHALGVLDSGPESEFDALVNVAALVCGVPISLLSLVDAERQWFKANHGLHGVTQTPRELAFCAHTVLGDALLEVPDATQDPRFADNPLVTGAPDIRFYAGAPLRLSDGSRVGTLCLVDHRPRRLSAEQVQVLEHLARVASRALERRREGAGLRQSALQLAASEARFRTLSEAAPLGVYATDAQGACTYTNPRWQEIYGLTAQEALGDGWVRSLHPLDRDAVFAAWNNSAGTTEEFDLEFRILRPDGSVREVHSRARAVAGPSDETLGYVGSVEDVTERKKLEAFLDRTGRVAGVGGWELDLRTGVPSWSTQTRRIHEVDAAYVPSVATSLDFYPEEARRRIDAAVQAGMEYGTPWDLELPFVTAKGRELWVRAHGNVEFEAGRPIRLVGALQDITEQRRRRLELQQEQALRTQLEQQVRETERLLRERSDMLDVMAHEVRQPLNNASAAMQSAERALAALGDDQLIAPRLQRAQAVLSQVLGSIDNTLAVAALLARPEPIGREYTDIDALFSVVVAEVPLPERGRIRIERRTRTRTASMDMSLMRLALRNLLGNALRYSPPVSPVVLVVSDSDDPLAVVFDVVNDGRGLAPEAVGLLFERNAHQGRTRPQTGQGLGLGLYIVRRVMELHGGSARLASNGPEQVVMRLVVNQPLGD
jgi:PAS domain S-box-containing protein